MNFGSRVGKRVDGHVKIQMWNLIRKLINYQFLDVFGQGQKLHQSRVHVSNSLWEELK